MSPDLRDLLTGLQSSLDALGKRILALESADRARISTVSMTPTSHTPLPTKGKVRAHAASAPSKAKPAKKERPTKKGPAIPSNPLPLHLAQTFPQEGKPDRHLVTVAIPDATAAHVIGQGGKGLKQAHDISGARVSAYVLAEGSREERHVSIRGTDEQIGDALVVLGKRIARKRIHPPKPKKKTEPTAKELKEDLDRLRASAPRVPYNRPSAPIPAPSLQPTASLQPPPPRRDWSTPVSRTPSQGEQVVPTPPSVQMASPSPLATPHAPTVAMSSPPPTDYPPAWSPMQIDAARTGGLAAALALAPEPPTPRRQTARRGGRGTPKGS